MHNSIDLATNTTICTNKTLFKNIDFNALRQNGA